jgi:uncharacterized damage-inducible protein DinB
MNEIDNIIELTNTVRESTLKRLALVPEGYEEWRIAEEKMSVADIVQHLIDCDYWMIEKIRNTGLKAIDGVVNAVHVNSRNEFNILLESFNVSLNNKIEFIRILSDSDLKIEMYDDRFNKEVSIWWIIMRGNIDHEIHHRGQLSAYIQMINLEK